MSLLFTAAVKQLSVPVLYARAGGSRGDGMKESPLPDLRLWRSLCTLQQSDTQHKYTPGIPWAHGSHCCWLPQL